MSSMQPDNTQPPPPQQPPQPPSPQPHQQFNQQTVIINSPEVSQEPKNGIATAGLVLGILACCSALIPVVGAFGGIVMALIAIPLSAVGISKAKKIDKGRGVAITGLILGIAAILIVILYGIFFAASVNEGLEELEKETTESEQEAQP